jgi:uncharacterized membrane protein
MPGWDNIANDLFGAALVAAVLVALALIVKLVFSLYRSAQLKRQEAGIKAAEAAPVAEPHYAQGELKLINVDEKTAALIMAIVSHESDIPLSELDFHSIRLIGQMAGELK